MARVNIPGIGELERQVIPAPDGGSDYTIYIDPLETLNPKATDWAWSFMQTATFGFGVAIGAALGLLV